MKGVTGGLMGMGIGVKSGLRGRVKGTEVKRWD